jgi:hypothetical protein
LRTVFSKVVTNESSITRPSRNHTRRGSGFPVFLFLFIFGSIGYWLVCESINIIREVESTFAGMGESPNTITIE